MISATYFQIMAGYCAIMTGYFAIMAGYWEARPYYLGSKVQSINRSTILERTIAYTQTTIRLYSNARIQNTNNGRDVEEKQISSITEIIVNKGDT